MKLHSSFNVADLEHALDVARRVDAHVDGLHIGSQLLFKYGESVISKFREAFPNKTLFVDSKIVDRGRETTSLFCATKANWITVMAGAKRESIHAAATTAREAGVKVMIDLLDARSAGQMALESQSLGAAALRFRYNPADDELVLKDRWDMVKGNATIPIMVSNINDLQALERVIQLGPDFIVVDDMVVGSDNPEQAVKEISDLIKN